MPHCRPPAIASKWPSFHRNCVSDVSGGRIARPVRGGAPVPKTVLPDEAGLRLIENRHSRDGLADTFRGLLPASGGCGLNDEVLRFGSQCAVRRRSKSFYDDAQRIALALSTHVRRDLRLNH